MFRQTIACLGLAACMSVSASSPAHCDTTRGPVVTAARSALEARDPNLVLHWVRAEDEGGVRSAFQQALAVRALGPEAGAMADRYFFETLVRIHRAGEGAPYIGLSDAEPEPLIRATDSALEQGSAAELERQLVEAVRAGLAERFAAAKAARDFRPGDISAGRDFVAAYVTLTHWVEGVERAASRAGEHHGVAADGPALHATSHTPGEPGEHASTEHGLDSHADGVVQHLPWILTGLLAVAALVEAAFLLRRRRTAEA